ncbi:MAG: hypothetical protein WEB02_09080 [Methylophaga sp.]
MQLRRKLQAYYLTAILGVVFAVLGFSYNTWRLENSENNSNIRTAAFESFKALAELEQIIYALHYDQNAVDGSPRKAWVQVGLINDLSVIVSDEVSHEADTLLQLWQQNWPSAATDKSVVDKLIRQIDITRAAIKNTLLSLD